MPCCSCKRAGTCQLCACFASGGAVYGLLPIMGQPLHERREPWEHFVEVKPELSTRNSHHFMDNDEKPDGAQDGSRFRIHTPNRLYLTGEEAPVLVTIRRR